MFKMLRYATVAFCFMFPLISGAQAPTLGSASSFVIFSSTGAVGNTGTTSQFTGDIGTLSGAITIGVNVNGVLHSADAASIAASASVLSAYQQLELTPPTDTIYALASYTLGNNDTLKAGVDSIMTNVLLDDTLILDGQNNAASIFIFKINGTFSSSSNAAIVLINGALACNVFWQVEGAISTASNTTLRGTFIANSAAISLGSGTVVEGRMLTSTAGAITANSVLTYLPTGCGSIVLTGPTAPTLGSVGCYALFTSNGANANSGNTYTIGDVGTNVGLTTGYNALLVTGKIHSSPDGSTSAAATDLLSAYTQLNLLTTDIELLYPALFGSNLVLTPHTYLLNAATALTDTLFLNAEGDSNAVFVFKVNGAFSTSTYATIVLTNRAQAKNVFWKIEGATTLNDYSVMKGTFISNNGAMNLNVGVHLDGRALTTTGAFSATSDSVTIPPLSCAVALPVKWMYFRGEALKSGALLEWGVTNALNNSAFILEKSSNGVQFATLAAVPAEIEGNPRTLSYSFTDKQASEMNYYRIASLDKDGNKSYYTTIQVQTDASNGSKTLVSVQECYILVRYAGEGQGTGNLILYSVDGRKISSQPISFSKEINQFQISKPTQTGMYFLYIEKDGMRQFAGKIMITN